MFVAWRRGKEKGVGEDEGVGKGNERNWRWLAWLCFWGIRFAFGPHVSHRLCVGATCGKRQQACGMRHVPWGCCSNLLTIWLTFAAACGMQILPHAACRMLHATKQNLFVLLASCITCISCYYRFVASTNKRNFLGHHRSSAAAQQQKHSAAAIERAERSQLAQKKP